MQASDENINEFGAFVKTCFHSEHYIDRRWDYWPELSNSGREKKSRINAAKLTTASVNASREIVQILTATQNNNPNKHEHYNGLYTLEKVNN